MNKILIYTVVTGDYDTVRPPRQITPGADYIIVTDNPEYPAPYPWTLKVVPSSGIPVVLQRRIKIYPYDMFPDRYQLYVYIDANFEIRRSLQPSILNFKGGLGIKKHAKRNCAYTEAVACIDMRKANPEDILKQVEYFKSLRLPAHSGMWESGILLRDNSRQTKEFCEIWLEELLAHTHRDQLALASAIFKTGFKPQILNTAIMALYFTLHPHQALKNNKSADPKIWYSTPYNVNKNIGKALNEFCALVPFPDDWIVLTDGDAMFMNVHGWGKQISDIIKKHGKDYQLIGCTTNRLASPEQCYNGRLSDETNLLAHHAIATELIDTKYDSIKETKNGVAGLCMIFQKKTWERHKFKENDYAFDTSFSKQVLKFGGKIGIAEGLYMFHWYRMLSSDPKNQKSHLI